MVAMATISMASAFVVSWPKTVAAVVAVTGAVTGAATVVVMVVALVAVKRTVDGPKLAAVVVPSGACSYLACRSRAAGRT